ncbi:unnamed protein product, partial [Discosporangium mesarthrocarpum]
EEGRGGRGGVAGAGRRREEEKPNKVPRSHTRRQARSSVAPTLPGNGTGPGAVNGGSRATGGGGRTPGSALLVGRSGAATTPDVAAAPGGDLADTLTTGLRG